MPRWWQAAAELPELSVAFATREAWIDRAGPSAEYHPGQNELDDRLGAAGYEAVILRERRGVSLLELPRFRGR